jgi:hypothetical protein
MGQIRVSTDKVIEVIASYLDKDHSTADSKLVG